MARWREPKAWVTPPVLSEPPRRTCTQQGYAAQRRGPATDSAEQSWRRTRRAEDVLVERGGAALEADAEEALGARDVHAVVLDVALVVSHGDGAVRLDVLLDRRDLVLKLLLGLLGLRLGRLRLLLLVISERLRLVEASLLFLCVSASRFRRSSTPGLSLYPVASASNQTVFLCGVVSQVVPLGCRGT